MSSLTSKEAEFLTKIAEKGLSIFSFEQAQALWTPSERTPDALSRLARKGWLRRLERGIYLLIPLEAGPARQLDRKRPGHRPIFDCSGRSGVLVSFALLEYDRTNSTGDFRSNDAAGNNPL